MDHLPASWTALCLFALALGARHGLDADHLATVDGLTRCNAVTHPRLARGAGVLFSLGHGSIVLAVAALASVLSRSWQAPHGLEVIGGAVSVAVLLGLAWLNVRAVARARPGHVVAPVGLRARLFGRIVAAHRPWAIALVGMLFALSFDTMSQAALFALAAERHGGLAAAVALASLFTAGMLAVDGVNGLWVNRLVRQADQRAATASRVMALTVAGLAAGIALFTLARIAAPALDAWGDAHALALPAGVMGGVLAGFAGAMLAARRRRPATAAV